jgi:hypothetical protein
VISEAHEPVLDDSAEVPLSEVPLPEVPLPRE